MQTYFNKTRHIYSQSHIQDFTLGAGEQKLLWYTFSERSWPLFFLPSSAVHIFGIFETHRTLLVERTVLLLLNKAGHTSQQSQFFR